MYSEVYCVDLVSKRKFTKRFYDLRAQRLFLLRCGHSKKVKVISFTCQSNEEFLYLSYGR